MKHPLKNIINAAANHLIRFKNSIKRVFRGQPVGSILMLHSIDDPREDGVWENQCLKLSPAALSQLIEYATANGCKFVSIQDLIQSQKRRIKKDKLIAISIDDGYETVFTNGYPCLKKYGVPFTVSITTGIPDGKLIFWWDIIEDFILSQDVIQLKNGDLIQCRTSQEKSEAFRQIRNLMLSAKQDPPLMRLSRIIDTLVLDVEKWTRLGMTWEMIKEMASDSIVTIGNHTKNHLAFFNCSKEELMEELSSSQESFECHLGFKPNLFAYPYGSITREKLSLITKYGFDTILTVNPDFVRKRENKFALPRFEVNEKNWRCVIDSIIKSY